MKKIMLAVVAFFSVMLLPAQGIYQMWGMTNSGGKEDRGVIFSTDAVGNRFQLRHQFNFNLDGIKPYGSLTHCAGKLYGMTNLGGTNNEGVIFEFDPSSNEYKKAIDLGNSKGSYPYGGSLSIYNGKFYDMILQGGDYSVGVIFEWDPCSNIYTKKFDFNGVNGSIPFGSLTLNGRKFFGMTTSGGKNDMGVIFEWDPSSNVYIKKYDFNGIDGGGPYGSLTYCDGKFYGMTSVGGSNNNGVIFEWEPIGNKYSKKLDLDMNDSLYPNVWGNLTLSGGKLYGMTQGGGRNNSGVIFEWTPNTNSYITKIDFNNINGGSPRGSLTLSGEKFYGMALAGKNDVGVIFEWDPASNIFIKKYDFNGIDGSYPDYGNDLTLAPAPAAKGLPGNCINFPSVTIGNSNNNQWVSIVDDQGDAVAEIKANGNNLGIVTASMFVNNGAVREDGAKRLYLDRNITLTSQVQPTTPVDIRLYIKGTEYEALKNAVNSNGQPTGINSIEDIGIYKLGNACTPAVSVIANPIATTAANWEGDYVFSASISSFSSFYFAAGKCAVTPPVITQVSASPSKLWPPNHQMENVTINYTATGNCGAVTSMLSVTSNEPIYGTGNGDKGPDWVILDNHHLQLRAERSAHGNGRVYTITIASKDAYGNTATKKTMVVVPKEKNGSHSNDWDDHDGHGNNDGHHFDCKVIPNPSAHYFEIQVTAGSYERIEAKLFDIHGRFIAKLDAVKNRTFRFGIDLRPGIYMVEIKQGAQKKIIRIVKQ